MDQLQPVNSSQSIDEGPSAFGRQVFFKMWEKRAPESYKTFQVLSALAPGVSREARPLVDLVMGGLVAYGTASIFDKPQSAAKPPQPRKIRRNRYRRAQRKAGIDSKSS